MPKAGFIVFVTLQCDKSRLLEKATDCRFIFLLCFSQNTLTFSSTDRMVVGGGFCGLCIEMFELKLTI
jgi:hypothetical protein